MNDLFPDLQQQLNKLSIRKMQFQITKIEFDFDDDSAIEVCFDDFLTEEYKQEVTEEYIGAIWEANDEDDLIEEITAASGWCIKSIDYRHILN